MSDAKSCACGGTKKLIFSCSGAADVGEIADRAARTLNREGAAKMFCMTGIGGRVDFIMKTTAAAGEILAIDGCPLNCASRSLKEAGFANFKTVALAEMGLDKGASPANDENIAKVAAAARETLVCCG